jgi:aminoglycoside 6'-N-acetyltransferase
MQRKVTVRRRIEASAEKLFDAWLEPASLAAWMHPGGVACSTAKVDAREGGAFQILTHAPEGATLLHSGIYRVIERPQRLVFTWLSPASRESESLVSVEFRERRRATEVVVTMVATPETQIELRAATPADLELLRRWDEQPHVIAADPNDDWGWEAELGRSPDWREQLIAELDGRPIGFVQIIDPAREESRYWGEVAPDLCAVDLWLGEPEDLGKGYGTAIMRAVLARCFADARVAAVLVDPLAANTRAHRFYGRLGFRPVERRRFGNDDCLVFRLERADYASLE